MYQEKSCQIFNSCTIFFRRVAVIVLIINMLLSLLIKIFKNFRKNLLLCQKSATFAVRNFKEK